MKKLTILMLAILFFNSTVVPGQEPLTISGGILNKKALELPKPIMSAEAKAAGACNSVVVQVMVDEKGKVVSASALSGHPLLRNPAEKAALRAVFAPYKVSDKPAKVSGMITYFFPCNKK